MQFPSSPPLGVNSMAMDAERVIARNFAGCPGYDEQSFSGRLHEDSMWDWHEYWQLEKALYDLCAIDDFRREVAWPIFRIFSYGQMVLSCHFDPNDHFKIKELSSDEIYIVRERFQRVFEGYFKGDMPDPCDFEGMNPLLPPVSGR